MIHVKSDWWKTLFDDIYLLTDARTVCDHEVTLREVDFLCRTLPLEPTNAILDLCGGQGRHSLELARRGFPCCTVLDYSHVLLERGRKTAQQAGLSVDFLQGDATATGLPGQTYDHLLILGNSLGYLPDSADDLRIMFETFRLLKPGGWLLVDVTDGVAVRENFNANAWHEIEERIVVCRQRELGDNMIRAREVVLCKERGLVRDQSYAIRLYDLDSLESLARAAGFCQIRVHRGFPHPDQGEDYGFMNHRLIMTASKPEPA